MQRYVYMIVVGSDFSATSRLVLHAFIENHPAISDWWHHVDSCYIIVTTTPLAKFQDEVIAKFPNQRFFLSDINPKHYGGWLSQDAWTWLEKFKNWKITYQG